MTRSETDNVTAGGRIFIIDDHPMFRHAVGAWLRQNPRYQIVGEAQTAQDALAALRLHPADAIVLDISLPGTDGLELIKHLRAEHPEAKILVMSMHDENIYAARALKAGAQGYLMKTAAGETFMAALDRVLGGEVWVSEDFSQKLLFRTVVADAPGRDPLARVSDRELEVLSLIGKGLSSREIAARLHLSIKTIESHRLHLKEKLRLERSSELVQFAINWVQAEAAGLN